jgi:hypothetical protein
MRVQDGKVIVEIAFTLIILVTREIDSMTLSAPILDYDPSYFPSQK